MALKIVRYPDLSGPLLHYNGTVILRFSEKVWTYFREAASGLLVPINGVTNTLRIVDKSAALIPWSIKQVVNRAYANLIKLHGRADGFVELTVEDLMDALNAAKREPDDILVDAGQVGHDAHHYVEALIGATLKNDERRRLEILAKFPEDDRATNCVIAALCFFVEHNVRFISSEQRVYSRELDTAGTLDGDILMDSCEDKACGCQKVAPFKDWRICLDMKTSNHVHATYFAQAGLYRFAKCEEFPETKYDGTVILRMGKDDAAEFEPWFAFGDEAYQRHIGFFKHALLLKQSVVATETEMREIRDSRRTYLREIKDAEKAVQMKLRCPKADTYLGVRKTKCLPDGSQCEACAATYAARQA